MTAPLYRLAYYSRNTVEGDLDAQVRAILAASRRNNVALGVSGALMFNAGCFAQVLEGPADGVEAIFERIQLDDRHAAVSVIDSGPCSQRRFSGWAMAFVGERSYDAARFAGIGRDSGFDVAGMSGDEMTEALVRLVLEDEDQAA
jgi:hypothetical protein